MKNFFLLILFVLSTFKLMSQCGLPDNFTNKGNMLTLNGINQFAESKLSTNDLINNSSFTVECWVKFANTNYGKSHFICEIGDDVNGGVGPWLWYNNNNDFGLPNGIHVGFGGGYDQGYSFTPCANTWYHIAYVFDYYKNDIYGNRTPTITVYVNGNSLGDIIENDFDPKTNFILKPAIRLGRRTYPWNGTYMNLNGSMDEFRLWNVARTATQIQDNYKKELSGRQPGLVAYYKFDDVTSQSQLADCGPNALNATIVNGGYLARSLSPAKNIKSVCNKSSSSGFLIKPTGNNLNGMAIYPNPTSNEVTFEFEKSITNGLIKIYDLQGRLVLTTKLTEGALMHRVNTDDLKAKGVFIVHINLDDESFVEKLIVQ